MDTSEAKLDWGEGSISLPIETATTGERAIDMSRLRADTGFVSYDKGYGNTAETRSAITYIDGENGILRHRGYPIEDLVEHSTFLEVAYLLYYGELPTPAQLEEYVSSVRLHTMLREDMRHLFDAFPSNAHPMRLLSSAMSALASYYPGDLDPLNPEASAVSAQRLIAKLPTIAAWGYKHSASQPYVYPRNDLDYAANFLHMMFALPVEEFEVSPVMAKAVDVLFILHADHSQNLSTSAVRLVGSGHANVFSSISAGIDALSGPLHGGANQQVVEMLEGMLADGGDTSKFLARAKDREDPFRLMGFGHRVYKNFDPRARVLKKYAEDVLAELGTSDPLLEMAQQLEVEALEDDYFVDRRSSIPNVDFYSGIIYRAMGFPVEMFTTTLRPRPPPGVARPVARDALEDPDDPDSAGPRQVYTGETDRPYRPLSRPLIRRPRRRRDLRAPSTNASSRTSPVTASMRTRVPDSIGGSSGVVDRTDVPDIGPAPPPGDQLHGRRRGMAVDGERQLPDRGLQRPAVRRLASGQSWRGSGSLSSRVDGRRSPPRAIDPEPGERRRPPRGRSPATVDPPGRPQRRRGDGTRNSSPTCGTSRSRGTRPLGIGDLDRRDARSRTGRTRGRRARRTTRSSVEPLVDRLRLTRAPSPASTRRGDDRRRPGCPARSSSPRSRKPDAVTVFDVVVADHQDAPAALWVMRPADLLPQPCH